jgi:hypothetical protein
MKLINYIEDKKVKSSGTFGNTMSSVKKSLFRKEPTAEYIVIDVLKKVLDNTYFLLCNTLLEGLEIPIPLILVGPTGLCVILPSSYKGICRAEESNWEVMDERSRRYRPGKPNLLVVTNSMAKAVEKFLADRNISSPTVEPLLIFTNPGVHVEATRPVVRIVLADALGRFAVGLLQEDMVLKPAEIQPIVDALQGVVVQSQPAEIRDVYSFQEEPPHRKPVRLPPMPNVAREEPQIIKKVSQQATFSRHQWLLLALLLVGNIIILIILVLVVVTSF